MESSKKKFRWKAAAGVFVVLGVLDAVLIPLSLAYPGSDVLLDLMVTLDLPGWIAVFFVGISNPHLLPKNEMVLHLWLAAISASTWSTVAGVLFRKDERREKPGGMGKQFALRRTLYACLLLLSAGWLAWASSGDGALYLPLGVFAFLLVLFSRT